MLFTIRRRSQVSLFLARVGRTFTLDCRVNEKKNVHLPFSGVQGDNRPARRTSATKAVQVMLSPWTCKRIRAHDHERAPFVNGQ